MRSVSSIAVITAHRSALLERALTSYIENSRHRRDIEYVVFDDSKDAAAEAASLEVARGLARRHQVAIRFAGSAQRERFAHCLLDFRDISNEVLASTLLNGEGYTPGQNRNAMLLDSVGSLCLCVDDDTVCRPAESPDASPELETRSGADPADYWCFPDFQEACDGAHFVDIDIVAAHERLLGTSLQDDTVRPAGSVVRITLNGLLGDCGWGAPFGLWHAPMGYLAFEGRSLDRLAQCDEVYNAAVRSRQILRVTRSPVVSDASFSMLTFCGLDNRSLLPPNLPVQRGQDLVFGRLVWHCLADAAFGHLPVALVHDPFPSRRFWPGEVSRAASGVDTCRIILEAVEHLVSGTTGTGPERLEALGRSLVILAELPLRTLASTAMNWLIASNRRLEGMLRERSATVSRTSARCASDMIRFCEKTKAAESRDDYWLPLDLRAADGPGGAETRMRRVLKDFGELLVQWPAMVEAARSLRAGGVRVSVDVS